MNQTAVAIGPWILHHLQALVTHMKKGVFVLWFSKSREIVTMKDATRRCTDDQEDWLERHCYPWTREDPHFCREHNEHYIKWENSKEVKYLVRKMDVYQDPF